jgi:hypothetical protein
MQKQVCKKDGRIGGFGSIAPLKNITCHCFGLPMKRPELCERSISDLGLPIQQESFRPGPIRAEPSRQFEQKITVSSS